MGEVQSCKEPKRSDVTKQCTESKKKIITGADSIEEGAELCEAEASTLEVPRPWDLILHKLQRVHFGLTATKILSRELGYC